MLQAFSSNCIKIRLCLYAFVTLSYALCRMHFRSTLGRQSFTELTELAQQFCAFLPSIGDGACSACSTASQPEASLNNTALSEFKDFKGRGKEAVFPIYAGCLKSFDKQTSELAILTYELIMHEPMRQQVLLSLPCCQQVGLLWA